MYFVNPKFSQQRPVAITAVSGIDTFSSILLSNPVGILLPALPLLIGVTLLLSLIIVSG